MLIKITGSSFKDMIRYGIGHLNKHKKIVNDLNVFPVPDGDTGTNMVMTMKNGLGSIASANDTLSKVAQNFANATVFGARGNSGVIVSQFFKGISEGLKDAQEADCRKLSDALRIGSDFAYAAVASPVEGTILTVIKDAASAVNERISSLGSIDDAISVFVDEAKKSLDNTPNLLPILAKAGVVDSGGSGIVYFFEGVQRYLNGEKLEDDAAEQDSSAVESVDYTRFNKNSDFSFGYCTECLIQLTVDTDDFDYPLFIAKLNDLGNSIVTSLENDKIKLHIHTDRPENILTFCHSFGEFLTLKIENMSVQHTQTIQKFLVSDLRDSSEFAVIAVAPNSLLQKMLISMGADVVIMSSEAPSSNDFLEAFSLVSAKKLLVFPNSSNSIMSAVQAKKLYKDAKVIVLNSRSFPQCYSSLAIIDFDADDISSVVCDINEVLGSITEVSITHASRDVTFGSALIKKGQYFSFSGDEVHNVSSDIEEVLSKTVAEFSSLGDFEVLNLFYGQSISSERAQELAEIIADINCDLETCTVSTENPIYDLILTFE